MVLFILQIHFHAEFINGISTQAKNLSQDQGQREVYSW